jgi:hypothetical protein
VQVALLGLAVLSTARWIGGRIGRRAMLFAPVLAISIPVLIGLQAGQFQLSTFSLSMIAMVLFSRGREAVGGGLLGNMSRHSSRGSPGGNSSTRSTRRDPSTNCR